MSVRLIDETAILACAAYVDLNLIRVGLAETIEDSDFNSAQKRCCDMQARDATEQSDGTAGVPRRRHGQHCCGVRAYSTEQPASDSGATCRRIRFDRSVCEQARDSLQQQRISANVNGRLSEPPGLDGSSVTCGQARCDTEAVCSVI